MSSMNLALSRKRLRSPEYRDSDSEDEDRPLKYRRKHEASLFSYLLEIPLTISSKLRNLLSWVSDLKVSHYFTMAIRNGTKISQETIIIDDDDDDDNEEEIQEVQRECDMKNLAPYIQRLENQHKRAFDTRHSHRFFDRNGSCSLNSHYESHRMTNGSRSYDWDTKLQGINSYSLRRPQIDSLKRPALVSNPDTDIEILLGNEPEISAPETDEIEILSESPSTKQQSISCKKSQRLSPRSSIIKNSASALGASHNPNVAVVKPQSTIPYTANQVVRLQEKAQYKLLLEKFASGSHYHHMAKRQQSDAGVQADTSLFSGSHFKKEVLHQPIDSFITKYMKPCQLISTKKAEEISEKKEPSEIKIDDDDDNDEVQILDIKLPQYKPRYRVHYTKYYTKEWLSELQTTVSAQTEERIKINEQYEKDLERFRKERLFNRLRIDDSPAQIVEPEFPELTPEMEELIDKAWTTGVPEDQLVKITSDYLQRRDIETLKGLNWLNDLVINSYLDLIAERSKQEGYPSVYVYNTFFYGNYKAKGYNNIRRWTRRTDIFSYDLNLVPMHLGVHWCLAVMDHRSKKICYYDSMGSGEEACLDRLHEYLCLEHKDKKGQLLDPSIYTKEVMKDIPQQMNGSDCGMFTLKYSEYISRDAQLTFSQDHMAYFRRRMVYELLTCQLL